MTTTSREIGPSCKGVARGALTAFTPSPLVVISGAVFGYVTAPTNHTLGVQGRLDVSASTTVGSTQLKNRDCELPVWARVNEDIFPNLVHTCKNAAHGLLQLSRPVDGSSVLGNISAGYYLLRGRYEGISEARVCSSVAEMHNCTLQKREDPDR